MQKAKISKLHYIIPIILGLFILNNTSALEYQSNTNIQFTLNPTISISVSDDLAINELSPGIAKDSNIVNVNVATNNVTGYTLSATVGNANNPTTNLTHITNNDNPTNLTNSNSPTAHKFISLASDVTELSDFNDNEWGYNYSADNGTTWHDYSTLPLYTEDYLYIVKRFFNVF